MTELINSDVGGSRVAVEARGISKSFGGTVALQGADLTASYGQVFAVLGENGAGKSTLMKVLAGALRPDSGTVTIDGSSLRLGDPLSAEAAGIGAVFQELTVIPDLTVAQNIFLRREPRRGGLVNLRKLVEATEQLFDDLSVTGIPPSRRGRDLTLAQKQIVEIVKVTARRLDIGAATPGRNTVTAESEPATSANLTDLTSGNHAIALCVEAWTREYQAVMKSNRGRCEATAAAAFAYQRTLPTLTGMDNVRNFIACVPHGMAIGAIEGAPACRLLYAARFTKGAYSSSCARKKLPG